MGQILIHSEDLEYQYSNYNIHIWHNEEWRPISHLEKIEDGVYCLDCDGNKIVVSGYLIMYRSSLDEL